VTIRSLLSAAAALCLFSACAPPPNPTAPEQQTPPRVIGAGDVDKTAVRLADIYAAPERFTGGPVRLRGRFLGWSSCRTLSVAATRSDWIFQDDSGCIYVTGGRPRWLDPARKEDRGSAVLLESMVETAGGVRLRFLNALRP